MAEMCATSSASVNEVKFNWKINNFGVVLTASGGRAISPEFNIGGNEYRLCVMEKKQVKVKQVKVGGYANGSGRICTVSANELTEDYIVEISIVMARNEIVSGCSFSIIMDGKKISSISGDSTGKKAQSFKEISFKNNNNIFVNGKYILHDNIFRFGRDVTEVEFEVNLYVLSEITNNISNEAVKDTGLNNLTTDMTVNSDFSIECGGQSFPCHELILRARSTVLDTMFHNDMTEASVRSMKVVDVGPSTMAAVLEFMYTGKITVEVDMKELIYIADKYEMEGLVKFCFCKLPELSDDMIVDFLFMADKHNLVEYKKQAMIRINANKSKYMEDGDLIEKLKEVSHLLVELNKL